MFQSFFKDPGLTTSDIYLGVGSGFQAEQTGKIMIEKTTILGAPCL